MTRILWTDPAVADLESIHTYVARDVVAYADALVVSILDAVERLALFPESGRIVPELGEPSTREIIVGNYRVIYETMPEAVRVLTILHGARRFPIT